MIQAIIHHCEENTEVAANRQIKVNNQTVNVRNRQDRLYDLYKSFPESPEIRFSSFIKYLPPHIKKLNRQTDVCGYCIRWRAMSSALKGLSAKLSQCCSLTTRYLRFFWTFN
jgi:hypothetical protein